jgi:hypothetical protein
MGSINVKERDWDIFGCSRGKLFKDLGRITGFNLQVVLKRTFIFNQSHRNTGDNTQLKIVIGISGHHTAINTLYTHLYEYKQWLYTSMLNSTYFNPLKYWFLHVSPALTSKDCIFHPYNICVILYNFKDRQWLFP